MKIDITSMFFNSRIEGQSATPAWSTSIGQSKKRAYRIDDLKQEVVDMIIGMAYSGINDIDNVDISQGSPNRDVIICSVFKDIFINDKKIEGSQYVLLLVREHSKKHNGRLSISYAPYIEYNGISNKSCIDLMQQQLGCSSEGCWFVYDISIKNQSDLHFSAVVINPDAPMNYNQSVKSQDRSAEWRLLIPKAIGLNSSKQVIYFGAPGTGKSFSVYEKYEKDKNEKYVFRTTFHPDMDYSMFVGCYKPTKTECEQSIIDEVKLGEILKLYEKITPYKYNRFGGKYWQSLEKIKEKGPNELSDFCTNNGMKSSDVKEVSNGMAAAKEFAKAQNNTQITYDFVPQIFTDAYVAAWNDLNKAYYLIIEEINRGNCAQIFGDLFQLLDRDKKTGLSKYRIKADNDLCDYLKDHLPDGCFGIEDDKLCLPPNLSIIATMNTSDQSLFPMDSAFKRRWEWEYVPIQYEEKFTIDDTNYNNRSYNFVIKVGKGYRWIEFLKVVNNKIYNLTDSEDKQMGNYFVDLPEDETNIDENTFKNKVMFYLWNDVCKDERGNNKNFYKTKKGEFSFNELFEKNGQQLLIDFLDYIMEIEKTENTKEEGK